MPKFTDRAGRDWNVTLSVTAFQRVKNLCEVDLMDVVNQETGLLQRLETDPVLLCNIVYAICKAEAETRGITDEQFGEAMAGDSLDAACQALLEALADFFRRPAQRKALRLLTTKLAHVQTVAGEHLLKRLEDPTLDRRLDAEIQQQMDGLWSGDAPESSESPPDH